MNVENDWNGTVECGIVQGPRELITEIDVEKVTGQMKSRKAVGLMKLVGEIIRAAGQVGVKKMVEICILVRANREADLYCSQTS